MFNLKQYFRKKKLWKLQSLILPDDRILISNKDSVDLTLFELERK